MSYLADKLETHKWLGDYVMANHIGADKSSQADMRMAALEILVEEAYEETTAHTVLSQSLREAEEQEFERVMDEDSGTKTALGTLLGRAIWSFSKKLAGMAWRFGVGAFRFLGRFFLRFLIRGLLMPVAGAVVSVLGLPVTIGLGIGAIGTYLVYKMWGSDKAVGHDIRQRYNKFMSCTPQAPTAGQRATGGYMGPTDQQLTTTTAQQRIAVSRAPSGGTAPTPHGNGIPEFIASIDPQLIEIGRANVFLADAGVDIIGMNQDFMTIFYGMVGDFVQQGGGKVRINSGYRDIAKQKRLYDAWIARGKTGGAVARPGRSRHQRGLALDIASVSANAMSRMGLLTKYKFIRPVRGEPWHLENLLFGSGVATQKAVEEAKAAKAVADTPTKVAAAQTTWLDKMKANPDAIAENDWPDEARKHPDVYRDEKGRPRTYKEIYERSSLQMNEKKVDSSPKEIQPPPKPKTEDVVPNEQPPEGSVGEESKEEQWIRKGGALIRS